MISIKTMRNITYVKEERKLPNSLVEFLEKTFKELHVALEPEVTMKHFSLEMHGPIYVLEVGIDTSTSLKQIGFYSDEHGIVFCQPEWVEKIDLGDHRVWRIGIMTDDDYLFQVILPMNEFGPDVEQWLEEQNT